MKLTESIGIHLNGEPRRVRAGSTLADMLHELQLDPRKLAVEHNLQIVSRGTFGEVRVADGDRFEIVHFVGGG